MLIQEKRHKNNWMLDIYKCPFCDNREYFGMIHWRDGHQYCRNCIYSIWENESKWKRDNTDYVFPNYSDGVNYYEKENDYEEI